MDKLLKQMKQDHAAGNGTYAVRDKLITAFKTPLSPDKMQFLNTALAPGFLLNSPEKVGLDLADDVTDGLAKFKINFSGLIKFDPDAPDHREDIYKTFYGAQCSLAAYKLVLGQNTRPAKADDLSEGFSSANADQALHEEAIKTIEHWLNIMREEIHNLPNGAAELAKFKDKIDNADLSDRETRRMLFAGIDVAYIDPQEWAKIGAPPHTNSPAQENE